MTQEPAGGSAREIPFVKMSGAGNDMILVDHRAEFLRGRESEFARAACDRRFGIGADGVILLEPDDESAYFIRFFNPDGGEYGLCGNGARCVPVFAEELGFPGPEHRFRSPSGAHTGVCTGPGRVRVELPPIRETRLDLEAELEGRPVRLDWGRIADPHAVFWIDDVGAAPVETWGPALRNAPVFGNEGSNVSFARVSGPDRIEIRTFERGVEAETLACGSGATVTAFLAHRRGRVGKDVTLRVRGGDDLRVILPAEPSGVPSLEGPVTRPFSGVFRFRP